MPYGWSYTLWYAMFSHDFVDLRYDYDVLPREVLGPHRRFDKDLWSSFSASWQKPHYGNMSWLRGNHLDKRYMTVVPWGLGNLVLINHGGNKLIYNYFCQAVHRNICCFLEWDFTWILFRCCLCGFYSFILGRLVHRFVTVIYSDLIW